jgi:serine/threonine-protein kinase
MVELYRQAVVRVHTRSQALPEEVIGPLDECIAQTPGFLPAVALHALASMRMWFMRGSDTERDWASIARASVDRAAEMAPELVETLLAKAMRATQEGNWRSAVVALRSALAAAPTYPGALQYLGSLQCEAGRADEGLARLRTAYELDPEMSVALYEMARCSALRGKMEDYRLTLEQLLKYPFQRMPSILLRLRVAAWMKDREEVLRCRDELRDEPAQMALDTDMYATAVLGEGDPGPLLERFDMLLAGKISPRFASLLCQLATEVLSLSGQPERALTYFLRAADSALIDLEWIDRCPALAPLRSLPGFTQGRLTVRKRVESIWAA